jgi:hypothetical protein
LSILSHWSRHWFHFSSSRRSFHTMLPQITPSSVFNLSYFGFILLKSISFGALSTVLVFLSLIAIFLSKCKRFRNLAIFVLRGIFIMTVILPQRLPSSFIDHFSLDTKHTMGNIFQLSFWVSFIVFLSFSIHVTILPLEMWHKLFCHNFEIFITLVSEETLITNFIYMITSWKIKLFLNSYGSMYSFSSFYLKNSTESFSLVLLQVMLACHSYHEVHF